MYQLRLKLERSAKTYVDLAQLQYINGVINYMDGNIIPGWLTSHAADFITDRPCDHRRFILIAVYHFLYDPVTPGQFCTIVVYARCRKLCITVRFQSCPVRRYFLEEEITKIIRCFCFSPSVKSFLYHKDTFSSADFDCLFGWRAVGSTVCIDTHCHQFVKFTVIGIAVACCSQCTGIVMQVNTLNFCILSVYI